MGEDPSAAAGAAFEAAQEHHERALESLDPTDFKAAFGQYEEVLRLMRGNHPATRYYLGTCQLDYGDPSSGVHNIAEALTADPANFEPCAWQRLTAGRASLLMECTEAAAVDCKLDVSRSARTDGAAVTSDESYICTAWDDVFTDPELERLDIAAAFLAKCLVEQEHTSTLWYPSGQPPRNAVEEAIARLRPLAATAVRASGTDTGDVVWLGCEYWVRAQTNRRGVATHYDMEVGAKRRGTVLLPAVSSILYLGDGGTPGDLGPGPTVILSQRPGGNGVATLDGVMSHAPAVPAVGVFVWPRRGRYAVFPGDLHHGVMPSDDDGRRVTVLVNWWRADTGGGGLMPGLPTCVRAREEQRSEDVWGLGEHAPKLVVPDVVDRSSAALPYLSRLGFLQEDAALPVPYCGRPASDLNGLLKVHWG